MPVKTTDIRLGFFDWLYEGSVGYICVCTAPKEEARTKFKQHFFHWPTQREEIGDFIESVAPFKNAWFCVNILDSPQRKKENAIPHNLVWSDLDTCDPAILDPAPNLVIESSPNRFQAIWKLDQIVVPEIAEDYSKRIAYQYNQNGADATGWDLTQLLRIPLTRNLKYPDAPVVHIHEEINERPIPVELFEKLPPASSTRTDVTDTEDAPELAELPNPENVLYKYSAYIVRDFLNLYEVEPDHDADWSARMWKLINMAFEAGMGREEVFSVAIHSKCNKYTRDRRPIRYLWLEILKAEKAQKRIESVSKGWEPLLFPELVDENDLPRDTFIDAYYDWASRATDAIEIYHELSAAIILSSVLAESITLEVSYGNQVPNLWGLILGDSTLTRKTTAMQMAMGILQEIDPEAVVATSGSAEGLLTSLSNRPSRTSVFYKDEVSGFFDEINKKDYLAGMPETLTHLYDVPQIYRRALRKETITITRPIFIFFGGGIRDKVYSLISENYIISGFLPRFLVVSGTADISNIRPTGPRVLEGMKERQNIVNTLLDAKERYIARGSMRVGGQVVHLSDSIQAILSPDAWRTYQHFETQMAAAADKSYYRLTALPTFERMSRSMLKLATLLAAVRQEPSGNLFPVEEIDVLQATRFIQRWSKFSIELIVKAGRSEVLRLIDKIRVTIENNPGIMRSEILRIHHLTSRELTEIVTNLLDRGEISRKTKGRAELYWAIH